MRENTLLRISSLGGRSINKSYCRIATEICQVRDLMLNRYHKAIIRETPQTMMIFGKTFIKMITLTKARFLINLWKSNQRKSRLFRSKIQLNQAIKILCQVLLKRSIWATSTLWKPDSSKPNYRKKVALQFKTPVLTHTQWCLMVHTWRTILWTLKICSWRRKT